MKRQMGMPSGNLLLGSQAQCTPWLGGLTQWGARSLGRSAV
jgi:hypothetical protein